MAGLLLMKRQRKKAAIHSINKSRLSKGNTIADDGVKLAAKRRKEAKEDKMKKLLATLALTLLMCCSAFMHGQELTCKMQGQSTQLDVNESDATAFWHGGGGIRTTGTGKVPAVLDRKTVG